MERMWKSHDVQPTKMAKRTREEPQRSTEQSLHKSWFYGRTPSRMKFFSTGEVGDSKDVKRNVLWCVETKLRIVLLFVKSAVFDRRPALLITLKTPSPL